MPIVKDWDKLKQAFKLLGMFAFYGAIFYFVGFWFGLTALIVLELIFLFRRLSHGVPELQKKQAEFENAWKEYWR